MSHCQVTKGVLCAGLYTVARAFNSRRQNQYRIIALAVLSAVRFSHGCLVDAYVVAAANAVAVKPSVTLLGRRVVPSAPRANSLSACGHRDRLNTKRACESKSDRQASPSGGAFHCHSRVLVKMFHSAKDRYMRIKINDEWYEL